MTAFSVVLVSYKLVPQTVYLAWYRVYKNEKRRNRKDIKFKVLTRWRRPSKIEVIVVLKDPNTRFHLPVSIATRHTISISRQCIIYIAMKYFYSIADGPGIKMAACT